jgi:hypothetical protein
VIECDFQHGRAAPEPPEHTHTRSEAHQEDLQEALTGLSGIVVGALTVGELLTRVAEFAAHAIPCVDGAGATVAHATEGLDHAGEAAFIVVIAPRIAGRQSGSAISRRATSLR